MKAELRHVGTSASPVVIVDDFSGQLDHILAIAENLGSYRRPANFYPGVRHMINSSDEAADSYVEDMCRRAAQFIGGAFDIDAFDLVEASFSIVSVLPDQLSSPQRAPHFDTTDQKYLALLHYLRVPERSGTAFFRQRSTGIERVTEANLQQFIGEAKAAAEKLPAGSGYIEGSDLFYEEIGSVEAVPDRLLIYQGSLLHSGIIPKGMTFSCDPRQGRLTANIFVRGS